MTRKTALLVNIVAMMLFLSVPARPGTAESAQRAPYLVKDINDTANGISSYPGYLTNVDGLLYFTADDGIHGNELWKSDGTEEGTVLVKDITPGPESSVPYPLTDVNGTLFFAVINKSANCRALWKSNGTEAGTVPIKVLYPALGGLYFSELANVNGTLFFTVNDSTGYTNGDELWKTDGTEEGTVLVKNIYLSAGSSNPRYLTNADGTLFFVADDPMGGHELWKSDGTEKGTAVVKDLYPARSPVGLTYIHGTLFFAASDPVFGRELWKSDGTEAGTVMVKDIYPGTPGSFLSGPIDSTSMRGTLFFTANDSVHGQELWKSDGTEAGTVMVKDIYPGPRYSSALKSRADLINVNGTLFFMARDPIYGRELRKSDGTEEGTVLVKDMNPGAGDSGLYYLRNVNGKLFFVAKDVLWRSDGTAAGTVMIEDTSDPAYLAPRDLKNANGRLFFIATDPDHGTELWAYDAEIPPCHDRDGEKHHRDKRRHHHKDEREHHKDRREHSEGSHTHHGSEH